MDEDFPALDTIASVKIASSATIKWFSGQVSRYATEEIYKGSIGAGEKTQETNMLRYVFAIALSLAASVASGIIFLFALIHQFAWVEIAASLATALQVYFLSSAIADMIEKTKRPSHRRNSLAILFAVFLVAFYSFTLYFR